MYSNAGSYGSSAKVSQVSRFYDSGLTASGRAYVRHVLRPENTDPVGLPSLFPYNTTVIRTNTTVTLSTVKTNGLIALYPANAPSGTGVLQHHTPTVAGGANLDDITASVWTPLANLTTNFDAYRVVAAVLKVQYLGPQDVASGFFAGCLMHGLVGGGNDADFDSLQEVIDNPKSVQTLWNAGCRVIWTPVDSTDGEFVSTASSSSGHTGRCFVAYSGFPTTGQLKVEAYITYEFLPDSLTQALFPGQRYPEDSTAKQVVSQLVTDSRIVSGPADDYTYTMPAALAGALGDRARADSFQERMAEKLFDSFLSSAGAPGSAPLPQSKNKTIDNMYSYGW